MNQKEKKIEGSEQQNRPGKKISRKEALKKAGFIAFSASTMMILLNNSAQAQQNSLDPANPDAC